MWIWCVFFGSAPIVKGKFKIVFNLKLHSCFLTTWLWNRGKFCLMIYIDIWWEHCNRSSPLCRFVYTTSPLNIILLHGRRDVYNSNRRDGRTDDRTDFSLRSRGTTSPPSVKQKLTNCGDLANVGRHGLSMSSDVNYIIYRPLCTPRLI